MEQPNILVVDDSMPNLMLLQDILTGYDFNVTAESDGEKVLGILKANNIDLVLLDIMMPKVDGFEVCRRVKADPDTKDIPVIFLTAKVDEASLLKGFELGGVDYIKKPFLISELMARVKTHLHLRRAEMQLKDFNRQILSAVVQAEERERARFAKDVHDGLGAFFSSLNTYLSLLSHNKIAADELPSVYLEMKELIDEAVKETKNISNNLMPDMLANFGLVASVKSLCKKLSPAGEPEIVCEATDDFVEPEGAECKTSVFRIINELLNNALKHSSAKKVELKFSRQDNLMRIDYTDDGKGFDPEEVRQRVKGKPCSGISNMLGRVSGFNGRTEINSSPGNGVKISIVIDTKSDTKTQQ
ncbi:MAG: response regulator [Bacteroidales bacterium]|nr:response regulator [Bacteroidales bacterium]